MKHSQNEVIEATKIVREELLTSQDLYNAFIASILSAIEDINKTPNGMTDSELAKHIADRIIGEE